jgi:Flp pilus assembly protein TadG
MSTNTNKRSWLLRCIRTLLRGRCLRDEGGSSVVEVAMIVGIFGPALLLGTVDISTIVYSSIEISSAAHAADLYGIQSSTYAADTTGMTTAAQNEAPDYASNLTVTPTQFYACSASEGGTQYTTQSAANSACTGLGNHALQFLEVDVSSAVTPAIHFTGLPSSFTIKGRSVMEIEE